MDLRKQINPPLIYKKGHRSDQTWPSPSSSLDDCSVVTNQYQNDLKEKIKLRKLCWETMFGQELVKLTIMDLLFTIMSIFWGDFFISAFLRVFNPCWMCWDLEKTFPKYPDFKVRNI